MTRPFRFSVQASTVMAPDQFRDLATRAEDLGYSAVSMADHLDAQLAPMLALGAAAAVTSTLRLQTLVLANDYRHPAIVAKEAATLDLLSDGRLELGLGAGWMRLDYQQMGLSYDRAGRRIQRLAEALSIIDGLLRGDTVDHDGEHYSIHGLTGLPRPAQQPRPPLVVAGGGRRILSLAARHADIVGLNPGLGAGVIDDRAGPSATPAATDRKLEWIRDAAGNRFDRIELQTRVHIAAIDDDRVSMAAAMAPILGLSPEAALESPHALVGTVEQCVDTLEGWRDRWGISYVGLSADVMVAMAPVVDRLAGR